MLYDINDEILPVIKFIEYNSEADGDIIKLMFDIPIYEEEIVIKQSQTYSRMSKGDMLCQVITGFVYLVPKQSKGIFLN